MASSDQILTRYCVIQTIIAIELPRSRLMAIDQHLGVYNIRHIKILAAAPGGEQKG